MKIWAFHGMRRSGNHVVLNWSRLATIAFFMNDILREEQVVKLLGDPVKPKGFWRWFLRLCARKRMRQPLRQDGRKLFTDGLCVSLEDWPIEDPIFDPWPRNIQHVLLIRDPLNMFASRIRRYDAMHTAFSRERAHVYFENSIALWKSHAREFLGDTDHLPGHVGIYYDRWVSDPGYRAAIAMQLGVAADEAALGIVPPQGGGSSFEGMAPLGKDAVARRLTRHSQLRDDERQRFARITEDPELQALRVRVLERVGLASSAGMDGREATASAGMVA
jgi:hypothetical protein